MYYTVKTLIDQGKSVSAISRELKIDRKTVRKLRDQSKEGVTAPEITRRSVLDPYKEQILSYLNDDGLNPVLIHRRLQEDYELGVSYSCVKRYVRKLKAPDGPYVPLISPPGHEAQVDFGYAGKFYDKKTKTKSKVWVFCMRLSSSRLDYYELVRKQDVASFIKCHINAFEFFGGVPAVVKLDNLKAGVLSVNIYEPTFQKEYASMLYHYGSSPIACKVRYPQEKGKVESGVKYVKNNFFRGLKSKELSVIKQELSDWCNNVCNRRIHGTTRKIPYEEYINKEKAKLKRLPERRYEVFHVEERKVNKYGHIVFKNNFYSVPHNYMSDTVTVKSNGCIVKIYNSRMEEVAVHQQCSSTGEFITNISHNPKLKNSMREKDYISRSNAIGRNAYNFFLNIRSHHPHTYRTMMKGVFALSSKYGPDIVDAACRRASEYSAFSYMSVKKICENRLYDNDYTSVESVVCGGYGNDLSLYDSFMTGGSL